MDRPACATCVYFQPVEKIKTQTGDGECRRISPSAAAGRFPRVCNNDWCGEWVSFQRHPNPHWYDEPRWVENFPCWIDANLMGGTDAPAPDRDQDV